MKKEDLKELNEKLAGLPSELTEDTQQEFAEFGHLCATKYVPQLLRDAGLHSESQKEVKFKSCDQCFWSYQQLRVGCGYCVDMSEFVHVFSPESSARSVEYLKSLKTAE